MANIKWLCKKCGEESTCKIDSVSKCPVCNSGGSHALIQCGCGKWFKPGRLSMRYCSKECAYKYRISGNKKGKKYPHLNRARIIVCETCGKQFRGVNEYKNRLSKYCSKECWANRANPKIVKCRYCGKHFEAPENADRKFCSRECGFKYFVGTNSHRYKDGKSLERQRGRDSGKLANWRKKVYQRDGYTCVKCGTVGYLNAHHIKPYAEYPEYRFEVSNGITLCVECHAKEHNKKPPRKT